MRLSIELWTFILVPLATGCCTQVGSVLSSTDGADSVESDVGSEGITVTAPTITSVDPSTQFEGSNVTITGTNFTSAAQVLIRGVSAAVVSTTTTQIVATVPDFDDILRGSLVFASLGVLVPTAGEAVFAGRFLVRGQTFPPTISAISAAVVGNPVTITGTGFSTTADFNVVNFGGVNAAVPSASSETQLTVTVPAGIPGLVTPGDSTTVDVHVTRTIDREVSNDFPLVVDL